MNKQELMKFTSNDIETTEALLGAIKDYKDNGVDIIDAKQLTTRINDYFADMSKALKEEKDKLNKQLKPLRDTEKKIKEYKEILKKEVDKKRFEIQERIKAEAIKEATKTIMAADTGEKVEIVDQVKLADDFNFMNKNFKKERLLKKDIEIVYFNNDNFSKNSVFGTKAPDFWFLSITLDESSIKDKVIEYYEKLHDIDKAIDAVDLTKYGVVIQVNR